MTVFGRANQVRNTNPNLIRRCLARRVAAHVQAEPDSSLCAGGRKLSNLIENQTRFGCQGLVDLTARKIGGSASPGSSTCVIVNPLLIIVLKNPASGTWLMPTWARTPVLLTPGA